MKRNHLLVAAGLGLTSIIGLGGIAVAAGNGTRDFPTAQAKCLDGIDKRLSELSSLSGKVAAATYLTDSHESTLNSIISSATSGITALRAEVAADTDVASLKEDCTAVAEQYRVFALRAPQVHYTLGADRGAAGVAKANSAITKLTDAIAAAEAAGKDVGNANELLADMQARVADADSKLAGLGDSILGYTPADWNANHDVLSPAKASLQAVRTDLKTAIDDAKAIIALLKA